MFYNNLSKKKIMKIYSFVINKRKKEGFGQRKLSRLVNKKLGTNIHENTIANWIYLGKVPFGNEKTQFKPLPKPTKEELYKPYIEEKQSAQKISKKYKVSTIVVINWIKNYNIPIRTHKESMNTFTVKEILRNKKLKQPKKSFIKLSPAKAYILGVLCGDGHINKKSVRFEIRKDKEFIEKFSSCFKEVYGIKYKHYYYAKRDTYILYVSSQIICRDLLNYGDFGTFVWKVPKGVLNSKSDKIISNFLKGFYDSEGSASRYCVSVSSSNKVGIKDISLLLFKFGIKNKIILTKKNHYVINITGRERLKTFRDGIGFTIKRKMKNIYIKNDTD